MLMMQFASPNRTLNVVKDVGKELHELLDDRG